MDDEITVPTVHLCWNDYAIRGAVEALRAAHLDVMADDMAAQLKPAIEEPELSFSVINARTSYGDRTTTLTKLGDRWVDLDGNHVGPFASLSDVDVLRVGIGDEPSDEEQAAAKYETTVALGEAYSRGYHEGVESNMPSPVDRSNIRSAIQELGWNSNAVEKATSAVMKALSQPVPTDADEFMVAAGFDRRASDEWQRLDVANAQTEAYAKGVEDFRTAALQAIRARRANAITFERRDAHDNDITAIEGLQP